MSALTRILDSLVLKDGKPDMRRRRAELDALPGAMSNTEIRRLRDQLDAINMNADICGRLPFELLLQVTDTLSLPELFKARMVCRRWRDRFSDPNFCLEIIKRYFPFTYNSYLDLDVKAKDAARIDLAAWVQGAARKKIKKLRGQYNSMSYCYYSSEGAISIPHRKQYHSGRVATTIDLYAMQVRDLRTGRASKFLQPNRQTISLWALTSEYLVVTSGRTICAWQLNYPHDSSRIWVTHVPSRPWKIIAQSNQVVIATSATKKVDKFFTWTIGGALKSLDISVSSSFAHIGPDAILHPNGRDHLFLVYLNTTEHAQAEKRKITIQEYVNGKLMNVFRTSFRAGLQPHRMCWVPFRRGRFIICDIWKLGSSHGSSPIEVTVFDVWTKEYNAYTYIAPAEAECETQVSLAMSKRTTNSEFWDMERNFIYDPPFRLDGDDDFHIYCGNPNDPDNVKMVVWCFDEAVSELPARPLID